MFCLQMTDTTESKEMNNSKQKSVQVEGNLYTFRFDVLLNTLRTGGVI